MLCGVVRPSFRTAQRPLAAALLFAGVAASLSAQNVIETQASGAQVLPPVPTAGTASATMTVDPIANLVSVSGSYSGLTGSVTMAHLHLGAAGSDGPVALMLASTGGTSGTFSGSGLVPAWVVATALTGGTYLNLHTTAFEDGEVRGQFIAVPSATNYGAGVNPAGSLLALSGSPQIGTTFTVGVDNPLGTQSPGATAFLFIASAPAAGLLLPGLGMGGPLGEVLIGLAPPNPALTVTGGPWAGAGNPVPFGLFFPSKPSLVGKTVYLQGMLFDGLSLGLTEGMSAYIGS